MGEQGLASMTSNSQERFGHAITGFLLFFAFFCPAAVSAAEQRIALLVAHPFGSEELLPLRYTAHDVDRMREVLELLGGFASEDVVISFGEDAEDVEHRLFEIRERVQAIEQSGDSSLFVFYYSGHAKDGALRLGESRLSLRRVKNLIEQTSASIRIALLDSCRSGSITQLKGISKGDPIALSVEPSIRQAGQVLITSSSANEDAQESDSIQGSFFTHFLTTGLRGAADQNDDGGVTLSEAYSFAYDHTVSSTIGTRGGIQHPTYRFDLHGTGDVVLTRPGTPPSALTFAPAVDGHFVVFDLGRRVVVAEFHKSVGRSLKMGVAPGLYAVKKRESDNLLMQRVRASQGEVVTIDMSRMEKIAFADDYAKGQTITRREAMHGRIGIRLSTQVSAQTFFSSPVRDAFLPNLALLQLKVDFDNLLRRHMGLRLDFGFGGSGRRNLRIDDPLLGTIQEQTEVTELSAGGAVTFHYPLQDWFWFDANARLGIIRVHRSFVSTALNNQSFTTLTPGLGVGVRFRLNSWLQAGMATRVHYMFFSGDESVSLAYLDGGAFLTAVLR